MKIQDVKINFVGFGVNVSDKPRRKMVMCIVEIIFMNGEKTANNIPNIAKKEYRGELICEEFFVVVTTSEYVICNDKGEVVKRLPAIIGVPIACEPDYFICRKENTITRYNNMGVEIGSRELTENEIQKI